MVRLIITLLSICLWQSAGKAQTNIDSLKILFSMSDLSAERRIDVCRQLSSIYAYSDNDSFIFYREAAYEIAQKSKNDSLLIDNIIDLGNGFNFLNNYEKSLELLKEAIAISKQQNPPYRLGNIYSELGEANNRMGNSGEGIELLHQALDIFISEKDSLGQAGALYEIGSINLIQNKNEEAIIKFEAAKNLFMTLGKMQDVIFCNGNIGVALQETQPLKALKYFEDAAIFADSINIIGISAEAYNSIGMVYYKTSDLVNAEIAFNKSLEYNIQMKNESGQRKVQKNLGNLFLRKGEYDRSIPLCIQAYSFFDQNAYIFNARESCGCLYEAYHKSKNHKKAYQYLLKYQSLSDSLYSQEKTEELTEAKLSYEFEKEKELLAIKKLKDEQVLIVKNNLIKSTALGLGAFALLSLGFFWNAKRKNKIISSQKNELEKVNQAKDRIFAIVAHDLRKPVISFNNVVQKIGYLLEKKDFGTLKHFNRSIQNEANALNSLTDNLLKWALVEKEIMPHKPTAINIMELILDTLEIFKSTAEDKSIEVIIEIDDTHFVMADRQAMMTIVRNLIDNAIKFTPKNGIVSLHSKCTGSLIELIIKDTGQGIPASKMSALFKLTNNKSGNGTRGEIGTGLGLHIVKELLTINKGEIEVNSEEGNGTKFILFLPMAS